jgi:hypothetical protein
MLARIGHYILFLITLVVYLSIIIYGQYKQTQTLTTKKGSILLNAQITILAGLIPILVIPWILAGFFSKLFSIAIVLAFEVTALLLYLFYSLFRISPREVVNNIVIWGAETGLKYPRLFPKVLPIFGLLCMVGYFLTSSYIYFAYPPGSEAAVRGILTVNMALFLVGALFAVLPTVMQISSSTISNSTRRSLFVSQGGTALQMGIILTVYLGLMGIGGERLVPRALPVPHAFAQYIPMALLLVFYLVIIIIPYFIGLESRRRKEITMYRAILDRISRVIDAVGIPSADDVNQLTELQLEFKKETDAWIETEPILELAAAIDKVDPADEIDPSVKTVMVAYEDFKTQDPRVINFKAIGALDKKLVELIAEYGRLQPLPNNLELHIDLNRSTESHFRDQRQHYESMIRSAEEMKVLAPVLARLAAVIGVVPIVMQYGQKLVQIVSASQ